MITIATGDLLGILGDVVPFALDDVEVPYLSCVRVEWDGGMLHAATTDLYRVGWASWHPDDEPDAGGDDTLFDDWGGTDEPWHQFLRLDHITHLIKTFKLPFKQRRAPLEVELGERVPEPAPGAPADAPPSAPVVTLLVRRRAWTGHPAITVEIETLTLDQAVPHPRIVLAKHDTLRPVTNLVYNAGWLADFAAVRARGPLELSITGEKSATLVKIGKRFVGAIQPTGPVDQDDTDPTPAGGAS